MSNNLTIMALLMGFGFLALADRAQAQEEIAVVSAEPVEATAVETTTELNSSYFKRRDPFWPVGYQPPTPEQVKAATEEEISDRPWPALPIQGRSRAPNGTYRVLIEGVGVVGANKVVSVVDNGYRFYWRILRIDEKGIQLKRLRISKDHSQPKIDVPTDESRKENNS